MWGKKFHYKESKQKKDQKLLTFCSLRVRSLFMYSVISMLVGAGGNLSFLSLCFIFSTACGSVP